MELTDEQRIEVLKLIKQHIEEKGNCRVGWAIQQVAGENFGKSIHNIEKIANSIISSGEYVKEDAKQVKGDINIFRKPGYKKESWTTKNPATFELFKILIGIVASVATAYITTRCMSTDSKVESSELNLQEKSITPNDTTRNK